MSPEKSDQVDVVIVGAGMVGASLALAMSTNESLRIILVDGGQPVEPAVTKAGKASSVNDFDFRVSAVTQASQTFLDKLGVWDDISAVRVSPYQKMFVWDAEGTGSIHFDAAELHSPVLGHIVENSVIQSALQSRLSNKNNVKCLYNTKVTGLGLSESGGYITVEKASDDSGVASRIDCQLVVAADGAKSRMRQWVGIPTREWDYQHHAIVCTVETAEPNQSTAWQRFLDSGPLAFLPVRVDDNASHLSSIVWSVNPGLADELMALNDDDFAVRLTQAFEGRLGAVTQVSRRLSVPLRQRHAKTYVKPGFALVGDSAHTIHPLAGQGANLGFADAMVLAEEVIQAAKLGLHLGDIRLLSRFERRRQGDNLAMMAAMEGFKRLFEEDDIAVRWLRNTGMKLFDRLGIVKKEIIGRAMGNNIRVPEFESEI